MAPAARWSTGPFDIRAKRATLAAIPYRVEPNDIATMLIHHHEAAQ